MKFQLTICYKGKPKSAWTEEYNSSLIQTQEEAEAFGEGLVVSRNGTLEVGERFAELLDAAITGKEDEEEEEDEYDYERNFLMDDTFDGWEDE